VSHASKLATAILTLSLSGMAVFTGRFGDFTAAAVANSTVASAVKEAQVAPSGFQAQFAVELGSSSDIIVAGTTKCRSSRCVVLLWTDDDGAHFTKLTTPPVKDVEDYGTGSLDSLLFANPSDGFAIESPPNGGPATLYETRNGGRSWHGVEIAPGFAVYGAWAASGRFYFVLAKCKNSAANTTCSYELAASRAADLSWSLLAVPRAAKLEGQGVGVAAYGSDVWLSEQAPFGVVAISNDDARTFSVRSEQNLSGPGPCHLYALSMSNLWAECPTGMLVSFLHSSDGGRSFQGVRTPVLFAGTGGGAFAPITGEVAYFDAGSFTQSHPSVLYRLIGGGARAVAVGRLRVVDIRSLVFTDVDRGFVIGVRGSGDAQYSVMLRSTDGGRHWSTVP
jgi:hypothetical protein